MHLLARRKGRAGGVKEIPILTAATTLYIPDDQDVFIVTGSTAIAAIRSGSILPGREVTFIGLDAARDFVNNAALTTPYAMMLGGGSEITQGKADVICLKQMQNGAWLLMFTTDN